MTGENNIDLPENCDLNALKKVMTIIPSESKLKDYSSIYKALSDVTRLQIVYLLRDGELCVCEIRYALQKPQSTISHHLNILKNAGLLEWRKEGIWNHYQLSDPDLVQKLEILKEKK